METTFDKLLRAFEEYKTTMPLSMAKGGDTVMRPRVRHNFLSFNYVIRKMLEVHNIYDFHSDFPLPRSYQKVHALDDVMELMAESIRMPFKRSVVIKRPKI